MTIAQAKQAMADGSPVIVTNQRKKPMTLTGHRFVGRVVGFLENPTVFQISNEWEPRFLQAQDFELLVLSEPVPDGMLFAV